MTDPIPQSHHKHPDTIKPPPKDDREPSEYPVRRTVDIKTVEDHRLMLKELDETGRIDSPLMGQVFSGASLKPVGGPAEFDDVGSTTVYSCDECGKNFPYRDDKYSLAGLCEECYPASYAGGVDAGQSTRPVSPSVKMVGQKFGPNGPVGSNFEVHPTGAVRSTDTNGFRFDLLAPFVTMSAAGVMAEGANKYGDGNYLKGFKFSCLYNHLMAHLMMFMLGDESEDHLAHAQWNLDRLVEFKLTRSDLDDRVHNKLYTPEQIKLIKESLRFKEGT